MELCQPVLPITIYDAFIYVDINIVLFFILQWMYIVPIAIFVMISGASNPEPAAQGGR